jgi:hypothetical protein
MYFFLPSARSWRNWKEHCLRMGSRASTKKLLLQGLTDDVEEGVEVFVVLVTEEDLLDVSLIHVVF